MAPEASNRQRRRSPRAVRRQAPAFALEAPSLLTDDKRQRRKGPAERRPSRRSHAQGQVLLGRLAVEKRPRQPALRALGRVSALTGAVAGQEEADTRPQEDDCPARDRGVCGRGQGDTLGRLGLPQGRMDGEAVAAEELQRAHQARGRDAAVIQYGCH
ncbi:hypothetical protein MKX07_004229 [Trichoderma sp. CBMAI-0711]|nr:hypothetical protein MKX07_004229 [Trichoderma sp. CBMAI-0711]